MWCDSWPKPEVKEKTKSTKEKRNQRKQSEIENGRKNNRGLKEIKPIFTITMLDYFSHMSGDDRVCTINLSKHVTFSSCSS
jgi:hypothetical protein